MAKRRPKQAINLMEGVRIVVAPYTRLGGQLAQNAKPCLIDRISLESRQDRAGASPYPSVIVLPALTSLQRTKGQTPRFDAFTKSQNG